MIICRILAPNATVTGLKENQEYQFRVKAKNKAGPGQPSEPCERIITERKLSKIVIS